VLLQRVYGIGWEEAEHVRPKWEVDLYLRALSASQNGAAEPPDDVEPTPAPDDPGAFNDVAIPEV
jgi:hypothetical protein